MDCCDPVETVADANYCLSDATRINIKIQQGKVQKITGEYQTVFPQG